MQIPRGFAHRMLYKNGIDIALSMWVEPGKMLLHDIILSTLKFSFQTTYFVAFSDFI